MTTPSTGRLMQTPEIEPLSVAAADRMPNVVALIARAAERNPDREAMRWKLTKAQRADEGGDGKWTSRTYREMWDWVTSLSLGLKDLGIGEGDGVCIIARTRPEWTIADLASLALGAVTCPIYPQSEPGQAAFVINNVRATAVFVENAQQAAKIASIRDECPTLRHVITLDPSGKFPDGTLTLEDVVARADLEPANRLAWREAMQAIDRDHLATVIHTSGTTGNQKGAMLSHGNLLFNFE
ncbi:MAG: AMP-binding protein, partial [Candidatus Limnocylindria bacterium]